MLIKEVGEMTIKKEKVKSKNQKIKSQKEKLYYTKLTREAIKKAVPLKAGRPIFFLFTFEFLLFPFYFTPDTPSTHCCTLLSEDA
jgi:hypothetical protein